MSEWKEFALEQLTEPVKDTYNPTGLDDFIYIGLEHMDQETLRLNSIGHSTDVTSNKFQFFEDDILFGKLRPYFHKVCFAPYSGVCSRDILVIRPKKPNHFVFLPSIRVTLLNMQTLDRVERECQGQIGKYLSVSCVRAG